MKVLTANQMRAVDRKTIKEIGIPGATLMENAGIHVTEVMEETFESLDILKIAIICGGGNNGGDGYVVARQLYMRGIIPDVFVLCPEDKIKGDALINLSILKKYKEIPLHFLPNMSEYEKAMIHYDSYQVIVDAILGTGISKPVEGYYARVIEDINGSLAGVISVDIPSGLFADEYIPVETAVFADVTVTFTAPKPGLLLGDAYAYVGNLYTVAIGTPDFLLNTEEHHLNLLEKDDLKPLFLPRKKATHKGNYGHILIVGGARGKPGAARMAGLAALRSGVGLVTVGLPEPYMGLITSDCPELMTEPLSSNSDGFLTPDSVEEVLALLQQRDLLVLGPGLGTNAETEEFVHELLPKLDVPAVIDADALNCIAKDINNLLKVDVPVVLTPHPGEMARLLSCSTGDVQENREACACEFARKYNVYLILKGYRSLLADPGGQVWINPTGNPGMATAGSGDVLSGILGAFCARINHQNQDAWVLACSAAFYLHGLAGDFAADAFTEESLVARDIINMIHEGIKTIRES